MNNTPEDYAKAFLSYLKLDRIKNIEELAKEIGLAVREVDSTSFEGALIRIPNTHGGIVAVKRSIREPGRRKFTIGHEIGHFVLPGHGIDECHCKSSEIESWQQKVIRAQEFDANRFASEILLPSRAIYPIVNPKGLTLALAKELSAQFETSLTATLVKCAEVTEEVCAVVCSVGGEIKWSRKSEAFYHFIPRVRLTNDTLAGRLFENAANRELAGDVLVSSWIESDQMHPNKKLWEESIFLPYYNTVLSVLTF